ncbi:DUF2085 domain-containing protein [Balneolaceae bacterium ANBcel3]|nr:DUF2085 domain-containing protein [Balneolaceae bacterium ANBcel3]
MKTDYQVQSFYFWLVLGVLFSINVLIWATPLYVENIHEWFSSWPKQLFSTICHQQVDRSYRIQGIPLAVCVRCTGFFAGVLLSFLCFSVFKGFVSSEKSKNIRIFLYTMLVLMMDWVANLFQLWQTPEHIRMLTGFSWGGAAGICLVFALLKKK